MKCRAKVDLSRGRNRQKIMKQKLNQKLRKSTTNRCGF